MFLSIARGYCPELIEVKEQRNNGEIGAREELACLGIYARAELYEISGNCKIKTQAGVIDIAGAVNGIAIPSTMVEHIQEVAITEIVSILFIENKTNYEAYVLTEQQKNELVIYHGGFLSPQKKLLIQKIMLNASTEKRVLFWADIDLGGFRMFYQLQKMIPHLQPIRMSEKEVKAFASCGLVRSSEYLAKLKQTQETGIFDQFSEAIKEIMNCGMTIEQEVFLTEIV